MEIMTSVPRGDLVVTDWFRAAWHFSWIYSNQRLCALARDPSETGMPHAPTWLLWQPFSFKASVDRQTPGAEYIKRTRWHIKRQRRRAAQCTVSRRWMQRDTSLKARGELERVWFQIDRRLFPLPPESLHHSDKKKNNYALFPLIMPLISTVGFRNVKQNQWIDRKCRATSCFAAAQSLRFNRDSFVCRVNPHAQDVSLETKLLLTEKSN